LIKNTLIEEKIENLKQPKKIFFWSKLVKSGQFFNRSCFLGNVLLLNIPLYTLKTDCCESNKERKLFPKDSFT